MLYVIFSRKVNLIKMNGIINNEESSSKKLLSYILHTLFLFAKTSEEEKIQEINK